MTRREGGQPEKVAPQRPLHWSCQQLPQCQELSAGTVVPVCTEEAKAWGQELGAQSSRLLPTQGRRLPPQPRTEDVDSPPSLSITPSPWQPARPGEGGWKQDPCSQGSLARRHQGLSADLAQRRHLPTEASPL